MKTNSNTRNELLKRDEFIFGLNAEKTPSFEEMRKKIAEQLKKSEENINVYNVKGNFGLKQFNIHAHVYDSVEGLKKAEHKTNKQRIAAKEEAKKFYAEAKKAKSEASVAPKQE
ncbi:MAG: hypothetical protein WCX73_01650 [Candidatus Pacearchaeota archaeon]|jgi:ribosomal protein S24E